ncbi:MAG TPA: phosphate signaling complex protein PhoU [Polyangiaceae bacterium]|jgi:phosphate transport system protein
MSFDGRHTCRAYDAELEELRQATIAMGNQCLEALRIALDAFRGYSPDLAARVALLDHRIDASEMAIDALVVRILALRQPVATDLRFLAMTLKLVTDLERIGDEAVNIAERAGDERCEPDLGMREALEQMGAESQQMLTAALGAFVSLDVEVAQGVLLQDDRVDDLYGRVLSGMTDYMARHPSEIRAALALTSVAKYLERVADHATNVAEEVIFVVRGEDVRHHHASEPSSAPSGDRIPVRQGAQAAVP